MEGVYTLYNLQHIHISNIVINIGPGPKYALFPNRPSFPHLINRCMRLGHVEMFMQKCACKKLKRIDCYIL